MRARVPPTQTYIYAYTYITYMKETKSTVSNKIFGASRK